jgi:ribosomal-protein-alanine N-acetyltransferase
MGICSGPAAGATVNGMNAERRRPVGHVSAAADDRVYRLDIMAQADVPDVSRVERRCFPNPWPASAYRRELLNPAQNHYVVLRCLHREASLGRDDAHVDPLATNGDQSAKALPRRSLLPIGISRRQERNGHGQATLIGFAGMWLAFDEAHITTIGVDPHYRGHGLGELLLLCMVDEAIARGAKWLTLEVRVSNVSAQALYRKYGFSVHGSRKRYYSDNNEDALIMSSRALTDPEFRADIEARREALDRRLGSQLDGGDLFPFRSPMSQISAP